MAGVKLYYFDMRGRGELSRLVLVLAGKDFEDRRFSEEDWPQFKPEAPTGTAPWVETNGRKFSQSVAIANYFARENGLYGASNLDAFRIDEVVTLAQDVWQYLGEFYGVKDEAKLAEMTKKAQETDLPRFCGYFQTMLNQNSPNGVFVGKDLTLADLCVYDLVVCMKSVTKFEVGAAFPSLKNLVDNVLSNPKIKAYVAKRKDTLF